jgi:hypothetical protein
MIWVIGYEDGKVAATGVFVDSRDPSRNAGPKSIQPSSFGEDADGELYRAGELSHDRIREGEGISRTTTFIFYQGLWLPLFTLKPPSAPRASVLYLTNSLPNSPPIT